MKISFLILSLLISLVDAKLRVGFYDKTCPQAETIIRNEVSKLFHNDPSVTAALIRLQFHDCYVMGCDAANLIDSTPKKLSEKAAATNGGVRGHDIIDRIKAKVEAACPLTVSCTDVMTLATRDAVALAGGPKYILPTGRRDGLVSDPDNVDLPFVSDSLSTVLKAFELKGFNATEVVALMAGHSVGNAHCGAFLSRLTSNKGKPELDMDPAFASKLKKICEKPTTGTRKDAFAFLDQKTPFRVDNAFYREIINKRGVLQIDQELALDNSTASMVSSFASKATRFEKSFADVMVKLASFNVIEENEGEVRKNCREFNTPSS